ncbi:hypothetical protein ABZ721_34095 [Streptomyces sp. NPDC006733]|uniref:hypothetical protein n=1 Tax=Streptomyces sp. NPDC006733 TaxID=3155460 RepID=UPI0033E59989
MIGGSHQPELSAEERHVGTWLLSPSGRTAVAAQQPGTRVETRDFFATGEIVDACNQALEAAGSPLRLEVDKDDVPKLLLDRNLLRVLPVHGGGRQARRGDALLSSSMCTDVAADLAKEGSWRAVFRSVGGHAEAVAPLTIASGPGARTDAYGPLARVLVGSARTPAELVQRMTSELARYVFTWPHTAAPIPVAAFEVEDSDDSSPEAAAKDAARQLVAGGVSKPTAKAVTEFMCTNFDSKPVMQQLWVDQLPRDFGQGAPDGFEQIMEDAWTAALTALAAPHAAYEQASADVRRRLAADFGVNEGAAPAVGEVFFIVSSRNPTQAEAAQATDKWDHHLATVVAVDGGARITLENYNRDGVSDGARRWYFALYGPEQAGVFSSVWADLTLAPVTVVLRRT